MKKLEINAGDKFNMWTILYEVESINSSGRKLRTFLCQCDCGKQKEITLGSLRRGSSRSCGCLQKQLASVVNKTHGKRKTKEYEAWAHMIQRCNNPNNEYYCHYGERGIIICERWANSFENFYEDMGDCPEGMTLDRIDVNSGYYKENCRWTTRAIQVYNQRMRVDNKTGYTGVDYVEDRGKYRATIGVNRKLIYLGIFKTLEEAVAARKEAEILYYGELKHKTNINKIEPQKRDKLLDELSHRESKQTQITYLDQCNLEDLLDVYGNAVYDGVCWEDTQDTGCSLTGCSCSTINIEQED